MRHRLLCITIALVVAFSLFSRTLPAQNEASASRKRVTLEGTDASPLELLKTLFAQAKVRFRIEPEVVDGLAQEKRTIRLNGVPLEVALQNVLYQPEKTGFTFRVCEGVYVIEGPHVTLDLKEVTPDAALQELFKQTGLDFVYAPEMFGTRKITIALNDVSAGQALRQIIQQSATLYPLSVHSYGGIYVVQTDHVVQRNSSGSPKLMFRLEDVEIMQALKAVFAVANVDYVLAVPRSVLHKVITLNQTAGLFRVVLERVLHASDEPLTYVVNENIYGIRKKLEEF